MNNKCEHLTGITFRKATASGGNDTGPNCVEVGQFQFRKATMSNPIGSCVEVAHYAKATRSWTGNNCVEVGQAVTATASGEAANCVAVAHARPEASGAAGHCVEPGVATAEEAHACTPETCKTPGINPGDVVIRDSKLGAESPLAVYPMDAWRMYVAVVIESGMEPDGLGGYVLRDYANPSHILNFTQGEADAFRDGCTKGEFNYDMAAAAA